MNTKVIILLIVILFSHESIFPQETIPFERKCGCPAEYTGHRRFIPKISLLKIIVEDSSKYTTLPVLSDSIPAFLNRLHYTRDVLFAGVKGKIYVKLKVNSNGNVDSCWVIRGLTSKMDSIAINASKNLTFIPADGDLDKVLAFDCGPGNILIDQLMQRLYEEPMDKNGRIAKLGKFSERIFNYLLKLDEFIKQPIPRSTGREYYGDEFVLKLLKKSLRSRIQEPEIIHTIAKYTAYAVYDAYKNFIYPKHKADLLIVSGGGSKNPFIVESLAEYFEGIQVKPTGDYNLDEDFKEAICFAVLANELIEDRPTNLPKVSGAEKQVLLGKICPVSARRNI